MLLSCWRRRRADGEAVIVGVLAAAGDGAGDGVQAAVAPRAGRGRSKMRSKTVPEANRWVSCPCRGYQ